MRTRTRCPWGLGNHPRDGTVARSSIPLHGRFFLGEIPRLVMASQAKLRTEKRRLGLKKEAGRMGRGMGGGVRAGKIC